ncbi:MAG: glycosyltransferase [Clostridia bacterium]|nr:glycosyltransferase [Clostridia bacterium]
MKNYKLSVVVPVFNTEEFLDECILSVVNQDYANWEMLLVDDGSSDKSLEICKKYEQQYPGKIFAFGTSNKGVSHARNVALEKMTGDYVVFLDSDDYIKYNTFFSDINKTVNQKEYDCLVGSFTSISTCKDIPILQDKIILEDMINNKTQEEVLDYFYRLRLVFTLWRFVVKASVIKDNNLMLVEGIIHEDEEWCVRMLLECKTFKKLQQPHYVYRKRPHSIMTQNEFEHFHYYLVVCDLLLDIAKKQTEKFKKLFAQRCAYKCAGQVYYSLRDMSEFKPQIKEIPPQIKVYLCSSGTGKSMLAKTNSDYIDMDLIKTKCHYMLDANLDAEDIDKIKGDYSIAKNPDYPNNYFQEIEKYLKTDKKLLFVPGGIEQKYFIENNIDYCLIFPEKNCFEEYRRRLLERGNKAEFAEGVAKSLETFFEENNADEHAKCKIILKKYQFLSDVLI